MNAQHADDRRLYRERRCYVCLRAIPPRLGVHWADCSFITCYGACAARAITESKDRTRSRRGRRLSSAGLRRRLRAWRVEAAQ